MIIGNTVLQTDVILHHIIKSIFVHVNQRIGRTSSDSIHDDKQGILCFFKGVMNSEIKCILIY